MNGGLKSIMANKEEDMSLTQVIGCIMILIIFVGGVSYLMAHIHDKQRAACKNIGYDDYAGYYMYCSDEDGNLHTVKFINCDHLFSPHDCVAKNIKIESYNP
jgi:hypothetical protein